MMIISFHVEILVHNICIYLTLIVVLIQDDHKDSNNHEVDDEGDEGESDES